MNRPMKLVVVDEGKYFLVEETVEILNTLGEVSSVSINGKYRDGKTTLANELMALSDSKCFEVGDKSLAKTKGIWCVAKEHPKNCNKTLIFLDVEGLFDAKKKDKSVDKNLFCLAVLLSQYLIYNILTALDERVLDDLHLVAKVCEDLRVSKHSSAGCGELAAYFPLLAIVIRDSKLIFVNDEEELITVDEHFEDVLKSPGESRQYIKKMFHKRKLFALPYPVNNPTKIQNFSQEARDALNPVFVKEVDKLKNHFLDFTAEKSFQLADAVVTGPMFVMMAREYTNAINSDRGIVVQSPLNVMREKECRHGIEQGKAAYNAQIGRVVKNLPIDDVTLKARHEEAMLAGQKVFEQSARLDLNHTYREKFQQEIQKLFKDLCDKNADARKKQELQRKLQQEAEQRSIEKRKAEEEQARLKELEQQAKRLRIEAEAQAEEERKQRLSSEEQAARKHKALEEQAERHRQEAEARAESERQERIRLEEQARRDKEERDLRERQEREERREREARELQERKEREELIRKNAQLQAQVEHERHRRKRKKWYHF